MDRILGFNDIKPCAIVIRAQVKFPILELKAYLTISECSTSMNIYNITYFMIFIKRSKCYWLKLSRSILPGN